MDTIIKIEQIILNPFINVLIGVALLVFIWGIIELIYGADNPEKIKTGKKHLIYGIIGLFIMVAIAGIMKVIESFVKSFG